MCAECFYPVTIGIEQHCSRCKFLLVAGDTAIIINDKKSKYLLCNNCFFTPYEELVDDNYLLKRLNIGL